ncbi:unnamed protein product [Thlaspi arvense]|uniref:CCHC-type domain-containing protein n=1 Tax=Thlaspi arvense TaxID=13288 RepID=A0AAU9SFH6_THLAR|nr:unnamed protein product [Thlaspi arvense]
MSDEEMSYTRPRNQELPPKQFTSKVMIFTFDDIPFEKWNDRLDEFHTWMTSKAITSPLELQVYQTTIPLLLKEIHREFIGTPTHLKEQLQEEFFLAKCCSLKKKDLAKHFERQTRRYYALNGLNNPSLKDQRQTIEEISIGQIQQYVFRTLDKLCKQKNNCPKYVPDQTYQSSVLNPRRLVHANLEANLEDLENRSKDDLIGSGKRSFEKTTRCFLFCKEGHFAKKCPNKSKKKKQYLINSISSIAPDIDLDNHDLESVLSYDSDDNDVICGYSDSDVSSESSSEEEKDCCFKITEILRQDEVQPPHLPVTIFDPWRKEEPVHAIALIDTGAHSSIVLLSSMWLPHQQEFRVANAGSLSVKLKSKAITIEIFPGCQVTTEVLGCAGKRSNHGMGYILCIKEKVRYFARTTRNEVEVFLQSLHYITSHIFT